MRRYGGRLIYEDRDDDGIVEVIDNGFLRSLHFGSDPRQSCMSLDNPDELVLAYVRAMTSWQLFRPNLAGEVLMVGLGGGSLAKYLFQHFPECRLRIVEYRRSVVALARRYFAFPVDPRINILIGDGGDYICRNRAGQENRYSLMIVDAFDFEGVAPSIAQPGFFQAAQAVLADDGILIINLWGGSAKRQFKKVAAWMMEAFQGRALFIPVLDKDNIIGLAFKSQNTHFDWQHLKDRSMVLEQEFRIEFPIFLKALKKHNANTLGQMIST